MWKISFLLCFFVTAAFAKDVTFSYTSDEGQLALKDKSAMQTTKKNEYCKKQCAETKGHHCLTCCTSHFGEEGSSYSTEGKAGTCHGPAKAAK